MHLDNQRETVAEHLASCTRTALIIMESIPEFKDLNRLKVLGILAFHDDPEVITNDKSVDQKTAADKADELRALGDLETLYGEKIWSICSPKLNEWHENNTAEAKFCHAIDALDALVYFLHFKNAWQGWPEVKVRRYFEERMSYHPYFKATFEAIISKLHVEKYFPCET